MTILKETESVESRPVFESVLSGQILESDLKLDDPIPYDGWLPCPEQIRRFAEQIRSEPEWKERDPGRFVAE